MCGCEICIQAGTYQEYLNTWHKLLLQFLNNCVKLFMSGSDEQLSAENIPSRYSKVILPFASMCDYLDTYIKLTQYSCMFNCCNEYICVFVPVT